MSGIKTADLSEFLLTVFNVASDVPPHKPDTDETLIARCLAPSPGKFRGIAAIITNTPNNGASPDFRSLLVVRNTGFNGLAAGPTVSGEALLQDAALSLVRASGTKIKGNPVSSANSQIREGQILDIIYKESGNPTGVTRAEFNVLGVIYECVGNFDFMIF